MNLVLSIVNILACLCAVDALLSARSPQAAIAWFFALIAFPYFILPIYLVFGRYRFYGYRQKRTKFDRRVRADLQEKQFSILKDHESSISTLENERFSPLVKVAERSFTSENSFQLLLDGEKTFSAIFQAITEAKSYILLQFYIFRDDALGEEILELLCEAGKRGVKIYILYDQIGSMRTSSHFLEKLRKCPAELCSFNTTKGWLNMFQLNFRNHRKIIVVDGIVAFVGGYNLGMEYLGKDPTYGSWRDTQLEVRGPEVAALQVIFLQDWFWACEKDIELQWKCEPRLSNGKFLTIPSGPVDKMDRGLLILLASIHLAKTRLWISTPYFVPSQPILDALKLAAIRGVDVRLIVPKNPDLYAVWLASLSCIKYLQDTPIGIYRYKQGFFHTKSLLIDADLAGVGSSNWDSRSIYLNFEVAIFGSSQKFVKEMEQSFLDDFKLCEQFTVSDFNKLPTYLRVGSKLARLLAPIL